MNSSRSRLFRPALALMLIAGAAPAASTAATSLPRTGTAPAPAPAASLPLADAFARALSHNSRIAQARLEAQATRTGIDAAEGRFAVQLHSSVEGVQRSRAGVDQGRQLRFELGVAKFFVTGTQVEIDGLGSQASGRPSTAPGMPANPLCVTDPFYCQNPSYGAVRVLAQQALLRGAGLGPNRAPVDQARQLAAAAFVQMEDDLSSQLHDVEVVYWRWVSALRAVEIRKASLTLAESQRQRTRTLVSTGRQAPTDLLVADHVVAQRQDALALAESEAAARYEDLQQLMGTPLAELGGIPPKPEDLPAVTGEPEPVARLVEQALSRAFALRRLRHEGSALRAEAQVRDDAVWPQLNAAVTLDFFADAQDLGAAYSGVGRGARVWSGWAGDEKSSHVWSAGLYFSYPLGGGRESAEAERVRLRIVQQQAAADDASRRIQIAVRTAHRDLLLALERTKLAALAKKLAGEKLRAEEERYGVGRTTMQNVRMFQEDLDEASLRELDARVLFVSARAQVDYLVGRYLEKRGLAPKAPVGEP